MHRLMVDAGELEKEFPRLPDEALRHLRVLRPKDGEPVELFDGRGRWRVCRYDGGAKALRAAGDAGFQPPPEDPVTLFACVTKGSRWDWTVEKATELGVARIVPVVSDRTIVRIAPGEREAKRARWERVAADAARQSDAKWLPEIVRPLDFREALDLVRATDCYVGALTDPMPKPLLKALDGRRRELPLAVFVGPEGDFTPEELSDLLAIATPASFGPTVLRAETAAIYAVAVLASFAQNRQSFARRTGDGCS